MLVYTSATRSYLPKARVLATSLKRYHPDWAFHLVFPDELPDGFDLDAEPFDGIMTLEQLGIPDWKAWAFGHSVVELCTAVKGIAALRFAGRTGVSRIMYLDPDIRVFHSLAPLDEALAVHDILLTPHLLEPETTPDAIRDNELSALQHGVFNLGFMAARTHGQGLQFLSWWAHRLQHYCIDDIPSGLFTDQRWCDLAPAYFDRLHIVRDPGYNVATWNIAHRPLSRDGSGCLWAGDQPLRFYHFTGYDSGEGYGMLSRYAPNQAVASSLWEEYADTLSRFGQAAAGRAGWSFGTFREGVAIPADLRRWFRARPEVWLEFPDPYAGNGAALLARWRRDTADSRFSAGAIWLRVKRWLGRKVYARWPALLNRRR